MTEELAQQTKTKPQKTPEIQLKKQMQTFSFKPPIKISERGKRFLAVTTLEAINSVFNVIDENKSFSVSTPGYWSSRRDADTVNRLQNLLDLRSQKDSELLAKEFDRKV